MATSNARVAHSFAHGEKNHRRGSNFYWEESGSGRVAYSYGTHFALAAICERTGTVYLNANAPKRSISTARHFRLLRVALPNDRPPVYVERPRDFLSVYAEGAQNDFAVSGFIGAFAMYARDFMNAYKKLNAARSQNAVLLIAIYMRQSLHRAKDLSNAFERYFNGSGIAEKRRAEFAAELNQYANANGATYEAAHAFFAVCALLFQSDRDAAFSVKSAIISGDYRNGFLVNQIIGRFFDNLTAKLNKIIAREAARANESEAQRAQRNAKREAQREAREAKKREAEREKLAKARAEFLSGARGYISGGAAILRVSKDGKRVETSQGYTVDINAENLRTLRTLLSAFESGCDISQRVKIGDTVFNAQTYGKEYRALSIGCHTFALSEIDNYRSAIASAEAAI